MSAICSAILPYPLPETVKYTAESILRQTAEQSLKQIGVFGVGLVQEKIESGSYEPNAPSTIRKKKSDKPLIDTGKMRQSVKYVIRKKGSG